MAYTSEGETQKQYVGFNVKFETSSDKKISVWLKVLDFDKNVDSVDVTIDRYLSSNLTGTGSTSAKAVTYTLKPDKGCNKNKNGKWVQIVENWSYGSTVTSHYVRLTLTGGRRTRNHRRQVHQRRTYRAERICQKRFTALPCRRAGQFR